MNQLKFCYRYPHPAVTADCVIFGFDGINIKVLLIQRGIEPFKNCSGYVEYTQRVRYRMVPFVW